MPKFTPTKHDNKCAICGDTSGKCRETKLVRLCMNIADAVSGAAVPNYRFIGQTKNSVWGKFVADQGQNWTQEQRQEWHQQQKRIRQQRAAAEAKQRAEALSPQERDRFYRQLLDELTLHPIDRKDLQRRGLTDEQITAAGFKSVEQWQRLETELSHQLPGVNLDGLSLNTQLGYLCPIRDVDGLIVGCQIRLRDADSGRYRWLTSATKKRPNGPKPHLPNGELPLAVYRPHEVKLSGIGMTEGVGVKPFLAAQRLGQVTVGAAGGQFAASPETLKTTLEKLSTPLSAQVVDFYPDSEAAANPHVVRQYKATWELLQQWGYQVKVAWWGQLSKSNPDIDELSDYGAIKYLTPDEFLAMTPDHKLDGSKRDRTIGPDTWEAQFGFPDWLKGKQCKTYNAFRGFGKPPYPPQPLALSINYIPGELPTPEEYLQLGSPKIIFGPGLRLQLLQEAVEKGHHDILDSSAPGSFKSSDAGVADPEALGVKKLWYFTQQSRNPTTPTVEQNYKPLAVRNAGFVTDAQRKTPLGAPHLRWAQDGEKPDTPGNCFRTQEFRVLAAKNVPGIEGSLNPICASCHLLSACQHGAAPGASFRGDRRKSLAHPRISANLQSAPLPNEYALYDSSGAFIDEALHNLSPMRRLTVNFQDYAAAMDGLEQHVPSAHSALKQVRDVLSPALRGESKEPRYGFSDGDILEMLGNISSVVEIIPQVVAWESSLDDLGFLNTLDGISDIKLFDQNLRRAARFASKELRRQSYREKPEELNNVTVRWLGAFLQIWQRSDGDWQRGSFRIKNGELTLYWRDRRHSDLAKAMKWVCYLDGTATREQLALVQDIDPRTILHIEHQLPNYSNLKIIHITDLGLLGKQRSNSAERKVESLKHALTEKHSGIGLIDWKSPKHTQFKEGYWFSDSRGTNRYANAPALASFGVPCTNVGELQALYQTLTGRQVSLHKDKLDVEFQSFINFHVRSEIIQAAIRPRSHLRPNEQIPYYFVGDYNLDFLKEILPGVSIEQVKASDITLDVCSTMERNLLGILRGLNATAAQGIKQTQAAIAGLGGLTQGQVSKVLSQIGGLDRLKKIFKTLYNVPIAFRIIPEQSQEEQFLAREFLKLALQEHAEADTPEQLVIEVVQIIHACGWESWRRMVAALPGEVHVALSAQIVRLFPPEWRKELADLVQEGVQL